MVLLHRLPRLDGRQGPVQYLWNNRQQNENLAHRLLPGPQQAAPVPGVGE